MFWWNIFSIITYSLFLVFYNKLGKLFMYTFFTVELTAYSIFEMFITEMVCGTELYIIALIPALFLFTTEYKRPRFYFLGMNLFLIFALAIATWYKLAHLPPERLFLPERKYFFQLSELYCTGIVVVMLIYACFSAEARLNRITNHSQFLQRELEFTANHDALTGLMNRRRTKVIFEECMKRKKEEIDYAICIFDIDNFKKVNDTYGHDAGDFVLKTYSNEIRKSLELTTADKNHPVKIGRWGGEEFLIIFPAITPNLIFDLEELRARLSETPIAYNGTPIHISATFGISSSRLLGSAEEILTDADHRLLDGKDHGKNRIVVSEKF